MKIKSLKKARICDAYIHFNKRIYLANIFESLVCLIGARNSKYFEHNLF